MHPPASALERLQQSFGLMSPELQRAARWISDHTAEVSLWSMRKQAQAVGVAPATMLRLARAAGYPSYDAFRSSFQQALTVDAGTLRARAAALQAGSAGEEAAEHDSLTALQTDAIRSVREANSLDQIEAAAQTLLDARLVGFLGTRSSFGIAFQMRYAYQLVRRNSLLLDGLGSMQTEAADTLDAGDALVVISQAPYPTPAVQLTRQLAARGVAVVALTDSKMSPYAVEARHTLIFTPPDVDRAATRHPGSFFHTTAGLLGLAEHLVARLAARGGPDVLARLSVVEARLKSDEAYWSPRADTRLRAAKPTSVNRLPNDPT